MTAPSFSSINDANTAYSQVSVVSPSVNTASPQVCTVSVSDNTVYTFMVENPNGSNVLHQDLEQIHEDDLEAMDLKWQLSLLSVRAKKYYQKTGKKIFINSNDIAGYDKSKVECYNCHKLGHFARECRASRSKEDQFRNQDNTRKQGNKEDTSKAMLAIDGVGFDWSEMAEEQVQSNMALMAFSDSEVYTDKTCSKTCLNNYETLKKQYDDLLAKQLQTKFESATYKRGLDTVEAQLVTYRKNEVLFSEEVVVLKRDVEFKQYEINKLKAEFEKLKQAKDAIDFKIEKFDKASKDLDQLLGSQITDKSKKGFGYCAVPPPHPLIYNRPNKLDLSYSGLDEFKEPEFKGYGPENSKKESNIVKESDNSKENSDNEVEPKKVKENNDAPIIEDWVLDDEEQDESITRPEKKTITPTAAKIEKPVRKSVRYAEMYRSQRPRGNQRNWNGQKSNQLGSEFVMYNKAYFNCGSFNHVQRNCTYHQKKKVGKPQHDDKGFVDSGCSRHMTGNIAYLSDFKQFDRGYVAFGGGAYGGKITGKGTLKTANLDFEDVYFVNELKFNLFSVSQMCDKKNYVLFTDTECLVLSPNFKLPDENQILLKVPRKDNMYSFDIKNIVPKESLTCLVEKATLDESMLWHRRLGHINFKNINKLVKDNLVRGLPIKHFENDQTCVACLKGKQHRASCKSKVLNPITKPMFMLHMDLFGLTFVSSLMHKKYFLVVTDDYSRFTLVFFLTTKDETKFKNNVMDDFCKEKGIKREYSVARTPQQNGVAERRNMTLIEAARTMLADSKLPTTFWAEAVSTACYVQNRVLVVKPHNKTPYELFRGFKPALSFMRPFGCHVTILNTLDSLGKFDGKSDEGFFVGYSLSSKAFRVYNTRTKRVEENLHIGFLENKPMIEGTGPKWLFDIDTLTQSMNYVPVSAGTVSNISAGTSEENSQECIVMPIWKDTSYFDSPTKNVDNGEPKTTDDAQKQDEDGLNNENAEQERFSDDSSSKDVNAVGQQVNTASPDLNTGSLELNAVGPSVSTASPNEEDNTEEEPEVDLGNITNSYIVPTTPNTRIHKDHPIDNVIGEVQSTVQTRRSAFLYGTIEEEVYVTQPPGFKDPDHPNKVYKVVKALYGLDQAPRAWYETLANYLLSNGFNRGKIDQTLYIKKQKGDILLVHVYVDDIIFGSTNKELCTGFEKLMKDKFQMTKILKKFNYSDVKSASTPVDLEKPLVKDRDADDVDVHLYRSMIRYLKGKPTLGLWYSRDSPFELVAYTDSDYARATLDRKSTTEGYLLTKGFDAGRFQYLVSNDIGTKVATVFQFFSLEALFEGRHIKRGRDTKIPRSNGPLTKVGDEAVHKELGDRMERDATTASSLEAEQDSGCGPKCQDTILGDMNAQTRFEITSIQSIDPPLSRGYTLGSGEDIQVSAVEGDSINTSIKGFIYFFIQFHPKFAETHKVVAFLEKPEESDGFVEIIDFLKASSVSYALTIQALVDKKRVIVTESSIRRDIHLNDAEGTDCLPTATIFEELARMGYEKPSQKLTFYKAFFSPQWKYFIHTITQCLSAKSTAWNEFSSSMASLIICLATNQKFNLSKYIFDAMVKHLDGGVKFLLYPRFLQVFINQQLGNMSTHKKIFVNPFHTKKVFANMKRAGKDFSGRITPLFDTMMVQPVEEIGEDSDNPTDSTPIPIIDQPSSSSQPKKDKPSKKVQRQEAEVPQDEAEHEESVPTPSNDPQASGEDSMKLTDLMVLCTKLQTQVLDLQKAKDAQAKEIAALKKRIQRLERRKISRPTGLKRLRKVGMSQRVESSEDHDSLGVPEDVSKQGRSIEDIDADVDVSLVDETQERQDDDLIFDTGVLDDVEMPVEAKVDGKDEQSTKKLDDSVIPTTNEEITLDQTLIQIKAAKPKVVTTAATTITTTRPKDKGVVVQEPSEFSVPQEIKPSSSKDKGKGIMIEPEVPLKRKYQIALDEQIARDIQAKLDAELLEEQKLARKEEEEANIALIEKHFAALRAQEKRNRPPTKAQKRTQMSTYLKHMGGYTYKQLKGKSFDEIQLKVAERRCLEEKEQ
ncbi:putative ribonuclease H-like domain-containing protein [Tanacetum coccineum]